MRRPRCRTGLLLLAAALAAGAAACGGSGPGGVAPLGEVAFTADDGSTARLSDYAGRPVVVNLWATWCGPCVEEMPAFDLVAAEQEAGGVVIIGVNVGDTAEDARAFVADLGVRYPTFTDPDGLLSTALSASGYPATAFIGADGTLREMHQGALTADELRERIRMLFEVGTTGRAAT